MIPLRTGYPPMIRRAAVLEIAAGFGFSERKARSLIEGADAPVPRLPPPAKGYFSRDALFTLLETTLSESTNAKPTNTP